MFLLAVEEYFQQHGKVGEGNRVSCDNKGALMTFDKKEKRVPAASSNADVRRALRKLDRRSFIGEVQVGARQGTPGQKQEAQESEAGSQAECQMRRDGKARRHMGPTG